MVIRMCMSASLRQGLLVATALGLFCSSGFAQTVVPDAADPTKAASRFQEKMTAPAASEPLTREAPKLSAETQNQSFVLGGVKIEGLTVFRPEQFTPLYQDKIGKTVTVKDMQAIAAKIAEAYQQAGYALAIAYLPTQVVNDGQTLMIRVDEGHIGKVEFRGDQPEKTMQQMVERYIGNLKREQPLTTDALERYLLFINDLPGNTARAVLRPSSTEEGATDIVIYYAHKPTDIFATSDNRGSRYLGPWQHSLTATENGLMRLDERISTRAITTSPIKELRYGDMTYEQFVGHEGTKISLMGSYAKTEAGDALKSANVDSDSLFVQIRAIHPLLRSRLQNILIRGTADVRNNETSIAGTPFTSDRIRSVRLGASYDIADEAEGVTIIDSELSQGISGLGSTDNGVGRSRINGKQNYTKVTLDVSRVQTLPAYFSLFGGLSGQYAFTPLLSPEQYALGGPAYGTAYDPGEMSGDHALAGKLELRYGQWLGDPVLDSYQLYSYYDIGSVWLKDRLPSEEAKHSLASWGIGLRAIFNSHISSTLEFAIPLTKNLDSDNDNGGRVFAGVAVKY
jgi:hemolysin activation/secretion protein